MGLVTGVVGWVGIPGTLLAMEGGKPEPEKEHREGGGGVFVPGETNPTPQHTST